MDLLDAVKTDRLVPIGRPVALRARTVLLVAAIASALLVVVLATDPFGAHATTVISDVVQFAVPLFLAVPLCVHAARRSTGQGRWSWALIGAGCASWGLGQVLWTYYELIADTEPFPSFADVGFLAAVPFLIVGVARHPSSVLRMGRLRSSSTAPSSPSPCCSPPPAPSSVRSGTRTPSSRRGSRCC